MKFGNWKSGCSKLAMLTIMVGTTTPALAQEAATKDEGIAEIVVTAQFKDQNVQETPLAITAVDAALMESRNQTNIESVAQRAPSVQFSSGGQGGGAQTAAVNIRGIGQTDFQFPNEPGVGVYIDDVYYGITYGTAFDLVDLSRVEILRGPQGTLSGKNSIGGSLKLFSALPDRDPNAYVEATYGAFSRVSLKAATNFTVVDDQLFARVTGVARHVDGYSKRLDYACATGIKAPGGVFAQKADGCVIGTEGGQEVYALRGALRWLVAPGIENNLIVDVSRDRSESSPSKLLFQPPINGRNYLTAPESLSNYSTNTGHADTPDQYTNPSISNLDTWGISNTLDAEISDGLSLKSITAYRFAKGMSSWDADSTPESISNNLVNFRHEQFSEELRLSGKVGDLVDFTLGGYYYQAWSRQGGRIDVGAAFLDFAYDDPFDQTSKSAFVHTVVHPAEGLNITGGLRYTKEDKSYTFVRTSPIPGIPTDFRVASLNGLQKSFSGDHWDYRIAVDYEIAPDVRVYGQVSTGFKGGGINPRPFLAQQVVTYNQETSTSYELGLKSMLFDRKLRLNMAYFHNNYDGYQGQVSSCPDISPPGFPFCSATRNVGNAKIDGFEVEFDARPAPGLSIDGSFSYVDFRFVSGLTGSGIVPGLTRAPFVPKWKYSLGAQYVFELGGRGSLTPRVDWTWQSEMESNIPNSIVGFELGRVEARGLANARLTYRTPNENWEASLSVTNLFDNFYFTNKFDRVVQSNNAYGQPGRPREWMVSIKRKF